MADAYETMRGPRPSDSDLKYFRRVDAGEKIENGFEGAYKPNEVDFEGAYKPNEID